MLSLGTGDADGIVRGLAAEGEGESAATRAGRAACMRAGVAMVGAGDVSSVTGIGTGGGAGSSNAPHGSSSSAVPPQLGCAGALSNASAWPVSGCVTSMSGEVARAPVVLVSVDIHQVPTPLRFFV